MFTGIIEELGTVISVKRGGQSSVIRIGASKILEDLHVFLSCQRMRFTDSWFCSLKYRLLTGSNMMLADRAMSSIPSFLERK